MESPTLILARGLFLEALEVAGRSRATLALYARNLGEFETWLRANSHSLVAEEIETCHVRGFLLHLARRPKKAGHQYRTSPRGQLSPETIRGHYRTLSSFINWCDREGILNGHDPMRNVGKPQPDHKEMTVLTDDEVRRFLDLLDKPSPQKRTLHLAFSLMWRLGLRVSEVCKLRLSDLHMEQGWVLARGKGRKQRRLPVTNGLGTMLEHYLTRVRPEFDKRRSDALLLSCVGKPLLPSSLRKSYKLYAKRAGVPGTPHSLRHSFATKAARSGVNVLYLQKLLGHGSVSTTERYFHNSFEDLQREMDKLHFESCSC